MANYELHLCHLYGNLLNTYGDNGNLLMLQYVAKKMGITLTTEIVSIHQEFKADDFVVTVSSVILKQVRKKGILMWLLPRRSLVLSFPFEVEPHQNGQMIYELSNLNYIVENDKFEKEKYYQFVIGTKSGKRIVTKKILGSEIESLIKK